MGDPHDFANKESVAAAGMPAAKQQCDRLKTVAGKEMAVEGTVLIFSHGHGDARHLQHFLNSRTSHSSTRAKWVERLSTPGRHGFAGVR
jgi:hypothetical protein